MIKFKKILLFATVLFNFLFAQDTIKVMSYNLLNYSSSDANKNRYKDLRTIVQYAKPDALLVCEISEANAPQLLLDSAMNAAGVGTYTRAAYYNGTDTDNMLFYKTNKLKLKSQKEIFTVLRDITQYRVYKVLAPGDTAYIYLHVGHLKAGSLPSDESQRNTEVNAFCSDIASIPQNANIVFAGDFNLKSSVEAAWGTLTSTACAHVFSDPINQVGLWYNNPAYIPIHTQSTRSATNAGCCGGATGGLDDRFDFLLVNNPIMNGTSKVKYIQNSYTAIGNDAQHFNLGVNEAPTNTSVPANVAQALFNMSDHLPVAFKLELKSIFTGLSDIEKQINLKIWTVSDGFTSAIAVTSNNAGHYTLKINDILGRTVADKKIDIKAGYQIIDLKEFNLKNDLYTINLSDGINSDNCLLPNRTN